jgi:NAD(P) transhydrogenase
MQTYDLIVIGSGPAGQRAAIQGAKSGKRVMLVEKREVLGGACINTGTIPSKTMREAVMLFSGVGAQGSNRPKEKVSMSDLSFRVQHVIKTEVDVTTAQLSRNNIEVLSGTATFLDSTHIRITNSRGQADYEAPISSSPREPNLPPPPRFRSTTARSSTAIKFWI